MSPAVISLLLLTLSWVLVCLRPTWLQLISLATVAVSQREREPVAATLGFLTHLVALGDKLAGEQEGPAMAQRAR
jgi:hypothetical protein